VDDHQFSRRSPVAAAADDDDVTQAGYKYFHLSGVTILRDVRRCTEHEQNRRKRRVLPR